MHTPLCRHAVGEPSDLAAHAVKVGLTEIGFSEHCPMPRDDWDEWHMRLSELDAYFEKIEQARRDHPTLTIKVGLEVDYLPGFEDWIRQLATRHPWDYFLGAVHYVSETWALDDPGRISEWKQRDPFVVWSAYYNRMIKAAETGLFETMAHPDLCKKFGFYPTEDYTDLYGQFLAAVKRHNVAVEINTAGLRKDCKEIYPSPTFLKMAFERKIPISFGSDAHAPGEVGANFTEAIELARSVGYTQYCRFTRRSREMVGL